MMFIVRRTTLHCDECDYEEETEIEVSLVGKKCPKCEAVLLTQADYEAAVRYRNRMTQTAEGYVFTEELVNSPPDDVEIVRIDNKDGTGKNIIRSKRKPN